MFISLSSRTIRLFLTASLLLSVFVAPAAAQDTAFRQTVAEAAARDEDLAAFYRAREFQGIWSGTADRSRRNALMEAFASAANQPASRKI